MCRKSQIFPEDCLQSFSLNTNILRNKETLDYLWKENLKMLCQRTLTLFAVLCLSLMTSLTSLTDMHWCRCVCWWRSLLQQQKYVGFSYYAKGHSGAPLLRITVVRFSIPSIFLPHVSDYFMQSLAAAVSND